MSSNQGVQASTQDESIQYLQEQILGEIATSETLRSWVLSPEGSPQRSLLETYVSDQIPGRLGSALLICELAMPCNLNSTLFTQTYNLESFTGETIVASNVTTYNPKKVKLFIWIKDS